ncbi:MAG TPA: hypothetical protein VGK41_09715, partial [Solirubrobacterales bacterium]
MKTKFSLILACASFLAVTALGSTFAGAEPLSESAIVDPSATTTTAVPSLQAPACANGIDDDGDGLVDEKDPDCEDPEDTDEAPTPTSPSTTPSESAPIPAPAPSPAPDKQGDGIKQGNTIDGGSAGKGGATANDALGDTSGGGGSTGAVSAPGANGGGDQPLPKGPDGGSQYSEGGAPTATNPTTTFAPFGPAPIGVP